MEALSLPEMQVFTTIAEVRAAVTKQRAADLPAATTTTSSHSMPAAENREAVA